jgi:Domain of unknown function (DUF4169)
MAEIVNLNRIRKARAKQEAQSEAERNRVTFGRTKSEKQTAARTVELDSRRLDGKKVDKDE